MPVINNFEVNVRNSAELVEFLHSVRLPENYVLVSLDVVSLFTNVPNMPKDNLIELVKMCFDTSYFTFQNDYYIQLDGSAMGNPASPSLANLMMNHVLRKVRFKALHMNDNGVNKIKTQGNRFRFPFVKGLSHGTSSSFRFTDWRPAFYNIRTIGDIYSKLKDITPLGQASELVYKIPCSCGKSYVGQTRQYLSKRLHQHRYSCEEKFRSKEDRTALANHHFLTGHNFDFDGVKIVDREGNWFKRNISEMVHICLSDTVNWRTNTDRLSKVYIGLIEKYEGNRNSA
ncbi:Protein of unknown function [Cotesia congregata]|uniref:Reverse transcriptase domain-containing protein n=1 Tax=Cotesia congregata TaxID=51543 RepID=A0A8J2H8Y3_COTCN|nr:Protein of unknown function [Cotesia congregata]